MMIRGGLGFMDEKRLLLPPSLLQPLNVGLGSVLYGIYYPQTYPLYVSEAKAKTKSGGKGSREDNHEHKSILHDFCFTTIAPRFWCVSATLIINVKHQPGSLEPVLKFLKDRNISILRAECSRASHRYATWNVTVCFEDLINKFENKINKHEKKRRLKGLENELPPYHFVEQVQKAVTKVAKTLNKKLTRKQIRAAKKKLAKNGDKNGYLPAQYYLFRESGKDGDCDPQLGKPVVVHKAISTLPYFKNINIKSKKIRERSYLGEMQPFKHFYIENEEHNEKGGDKNNARILERLFEPFELHAGPTFVRCSKIKSILEVSSQLDVNRQFAFGSSDEIRVDQPKLFPACVFAEVDTTQLTLRLAFLTHEQVERFFEVEIEYERHERIDQATTSKGLFHFILQKLPCKINIWRTYNQTTSDDPLKETGLIRLIVEHCEPVNFGSSRLQFIKGAFEKLRGYCINSDLAHVNLKDIMVNAVEPENVKNTLLESLEIATGFKYDVFISYHSEDEEFADAVNAYLKQQGVNAFMARSEIQTGDDFLPVIKDGLLKSREMCLIWSRNVNSKLEEEKAREWVTTEWGIAWALDKPIVPFLINGKRSNDLPMRLRSFQAIDFSPSPKNFNEQMEKYLETLKSRMREARRKTYFEEH